MSAKVENVVIGGESTVFVNDEPIDTINPPWYKSDDGTLQIVDILERFGIHHNWHRAEAIRSLMRAGKKQQPGMTWLESIIDDLEKAKWYIDREISLASKGLS